MSPAFRWVVVLALVVCAQVSRAADNFARRNLVAWCVVPFDKLKRTPAQRAEMLERIGIRRLAYDWRDEHLPTFDEELRELKAHGIELTAVWFPGAINAQARVLLDELKRHGIKTQLWVMTGATTVDDGVAAIGPIAKEAAAIGCTVALYNHGGWWGEPENQIAIIDRLREQDIKNVGIVYNLHHGHDHLPRFAEVLAKMKPHLMCLNLNGMIEGGDKKGQKIVPVGYGTLDQQLLKTIRDSGYAGPIGILNHTDEDAEGRLLDNIDGIEWLVPQFEGSPPGPKPGLRTYKPAPEPKAAVNYWSVEDPAERAKLPPYRTIPAAAVEDLTPAKQGRPDEGQWYRSHGSNASARYSPLTQINPSNVKSLRVAWTYRSGDGKGNIQCNPVVVDGVMYAPTVGEHVVAVDAATGREIWRFKAEGRPAYRGLVYHRGSPDRVLFVAGSNLWAIEAKTGRPVASFGDGGRVSVPPVAVAPAVYRDVVIVAGFERDVFAFDVNTGQPRWTFHTVPREGEAYADTWDQAQDGANCWGGTALDAARGIYYVTLGSPKPNFLGAGHLGDNLYSNCVVALDAATGTRLWHFQEIPHDIWDLDIPAPPVLVTVTRQGKRVDAVAAVTKIGNTLLLDRVTGKPLFPFRMRRAPVSKLPGERTAPYQPEVELPEPFTRPFWSAGDVTERSAEARRFVLDKIGDAKFGWFEPFDERRPLVMKGFHGGAEWTGAAFDPGTGLLYVNSNEIPWLPMVYRSETPAVDETKGPKTAGRLVYERNCQACHGPSREGLAVNPPLLGLADRTTEADVLRLVETGRGSMPAMKHLTEAERKDLIEYLFDRDRPGVKAAGRPERPTYRSVGYPKLLDHEGYPGCKPPWGLLVAIDLNTGKIAWKVPLGEHEELTRLGTPKTGTENFGGPTVTAGGLVFCGGTRDIKIRAFDKATGEELWSAPLPFGGFAPPTTYEVNGKQYVLIPATGGGKLDTAQGDAYVAFALP